MSKVIGLKCRECGTEYPSGIQNTCYKCFGPLEVHYDWDEIQNSNGYAASVTNEEILDAILLLARTEGIFTEPAGGTTVAGLKSLVESGHIDPEERTVVYVTGNGLKAKETIAGVLDSPGSIKPTYSEFTNTFRNITKEQAPTCQEVN
ncbi:MAG: pyridoxal-phosphate dependent enzyme [Methanococcoides sp.]|nr:pyridoxal-phosphate dependent enzyme [Methanococcoides sp.]